MKKVIFSFTLIFCFLTGLIGQEVDPSFGSDGSMSFSGPSSILEAHPNGDFWVTQYIPGFGVYGMKMLKYGSEGSSTPLDSIIITKVNRTKVKGIRRLDENSFLFLEGDYFIRKILDNGEYDTDFGVFGVVDLTEVFGGEKAYFRHMNVLSDGKILVLGSITQKYTLPGEPICPPERQLIQIPYIIRLLPDGSPDSTFGPDGRGFLRIPNSSSKHRSFISYLHLPDNRLLVFGHEAHYSILNQYDFFTYIYRLTPDGQIDSTFSDSEGLPVSYMKPQYSFLLQDGKFMLVGPAYQWDDTRGFRVMRFTATGKLDSGFSGDGYTGSQFVYYLGGISSVKLSKNGSIWVLGNFEDYSRDTETLLYKFSPAGGLDGRFGKGGIYNFTEQGYGGAHSFSLLEDPLHFPGKKFLIGLAKDRDPIIQRFFIEPIEGNIIRNVPPLSVMVSPDRFSENGILLTYHLSERQVVKVTVLDLSGKKVTKLFDGYKEAGEQIQGLNFPEHLPSGYYILHFQCDEFSQAIKTVLHP